MLTRRSLLRCGSAAAMMAAVPRLRAQTAGQQLALVRSNEAAVSVPADFLGLGYEMSSVATPGLLSTSNQRYLQLVRQLGNQGVLRVGGIVADYTRYEADGVARADKQDTVITRAALLQFAAFLRQLNWTAIWSLNFAQGTLADALLEAAAVSETLGTSLQAFELGNEVENYGRGNSFRQAPYTYGQFRAEYAQWCDTIRKVVPHARFAAPDTAADVSWVENMAKDAHVDVQMLTTHYYRGGQKQGTAEQLVHPDPKLLDKLVRLRSASRQSGIPWRMCETNSFFGGGRPGVSDTLIGALWTLDYLCLLAQYGCAGVNLETGVNQLGFISSYSPIQDDGHGNNTAGVPYYGMLAFAMARSGCAEAIAVDGANDVSGLTAYAFGGNGAVRSLVLIHRGMASVDVSTAAGGRGRRWACATERCCGSPAQRAIARLTSALVARQLMPREPGPQQLMSVCRTVPCTCLR